MRLLFGAERADELILAGQRVLPRVALDTHYEFVHPTIDDACAELARLRRTPDERGWRRRRAVPPRGAGRVMLNCTRNWLGGDGVWGRLLAVRRVRSTLASPPWPFYPVYGGYRAGWKRA